MSGVGGNVDGVWPRPTPSCACDALIVCPLVFDPLALGLALWINRRLGESALDAVNDPHRCGPN
jgi:hypothetical protein